MQNDDSNPSPSAGTDPRPWPAVVAPDHVRRVGRLHGSARPLVGRPNPV